jgi:hypothetical protein
MIHRLAAVAVLVLLPIAAYAHRLDEYLQATRLSIGVARVDVEIDLTPGVSVARDVFDVIDADRDGRINAAERDAYAREVFHAIALSVDDRQLAMWDVTIQVPEREAMSEGVGTIRLRASATLPRVRSGRHRLAFVNTHRPESSVYLVNALVPTDPRIHIATQQRDPAQRRMTLDYEVDPSWPRAWSLLAALLMGAALAVTRRAKV